MVQKLFVFTLLIWLVPINNLFSQTPCFDIFSYKSPPNVLIEHSISNSLVYEMGLDTSIFQLEISGRKGDTIITNKCKTNCNIHIDNVKTINYAISIDSANISCLYISFLQAPSINISNCIFSYPPQIYHSEVDHLTVLNSRFPRMEVGGGKIGTLILDKNTSYNGSISISNLNITDRLEVTGNNIAWLLIQKCTIGQFRLFFSNISKLLSISESTIDKIDFLESQILESTQLSYSTFLGEVNLGGTIGKYLLISDSYFEKALNFYTQETPSVINLEYSFFNSPIDLSYSSDTIYEYLNDSTKSTWFTKDTVNTKVGKHQIYLYGINQPILLDYSRFQIREDYSQERTLAQYEALLKGLKAHGFTDSYELVDLEYEHYKAFKIGDFKDKIIYYFQKYWWNYGYSRHFILGWTIALLLFFTLVNAVERFPIIKVYPVIIQYKHKSYKLFGFRKSFIKINVLQILLTKVYSIDEIKQRHHALHRIDSISTLKYVWVKFYLSFYYTSLVFFGLSMSHERLKFKSAATLYIYFIFVSGLVCLGFLANWIIQG